MVKLHPVKSSNVEAVGYDPSTRVLHVRYRSGGTYHYEGCTQAHYDGLRAAESVGKYLHKNIKGAYKARKLEDENDAGSDEHKA